MNKKPQNHEYLNIEQSQQYQIHDYLNIEESLPSKIDKLCNRINEHILKQNETNDWFRRVVDKLQIANDMQKKANDEQRRANDEQRRANDEQRKFNARIFEWMRYVQSQNSGFHY